MSTETEFKIADGVARVGQTVWTNSTGEPMSVVVSEPDRSLPEKSVRVHVPERPNFGVCRYSDELFTTRRGALQAMRDRAQIEYLSARDEMEVASDEVDRLDELLAAEPRA